jgi:GNAT superfamily N-acetyltransferase
MGQAMESAQALPVFRDVTPGDAAELARLAAEVVGTPWTEDFVTWKYFQNPAGPIYGCCAEKGGHLVGFYGNAPLEIKLGHRIVKGAQALDAMVLPDLRRQGLFVRMAQHTYKQMEGAGFELLYGVPNPISRTGLVKRLAWTYAGEIPRYVKVLNANAVSGAADLGWLRTAAYRAMLRAVRLVTSRRKIVPQGHVRIREVEALDARFDALWAAEATGEVPIAVVRDVAYLTWRYLQNPLVDYRILVAERGDALAGYAVLSLRDLEKDGTVALAELMVAPGDREAGLALLVAATARARELGGGQLQCWMVPQRAFYRDLLVRSGFVYWPFRFLPRVLRHTTSFIVRPSAGTGLSLDPAQLGNWFLTMGDQDHY